MQRSQLAEFIKNAQKPVVAFVCADLHVSVYAAAAKKSLIDSDIYTPVIITIEEAKLNKAIDQIPVFKIDSRDLSELTGISVFVSSDNCLGFKFPVESKVIVTCHVLYSSWNLHSYTYLFHIADMFFVYPPFLEKITPQEFEKEMGRIVPSFFDLRDKKFTIIKGGYLKIDLLTEKIEAKKIRTDSILFMPSYPYFEAEKQYLDILETIKETCPDLSIIFRPYNPPTAKLYSILEQFSGYKNIEIDTLPGNETSFARAKVLVTDTSFGRRTFAYATGRPAIAYQPKSDQPGITFSHQSFNTYTKEQLKHVLSWTVNQNGDLKQQLLQMRNKDLMNIGKSFDLLLDSIKAVVMGETREYWTTFERTFAKRDWETPDTWVNFFLRTPHGLKDRFSVSYAEGQKKFPDHGYFALNFHVDDYIYEIDYKNFSIKAADKKLIEKLENQELVLYKSPHTGPLQPNHMSSFKEIVLFCINDLIKFEHNLLKRLAIKKDKYIKCETNFEEKCKLLFAIQVLLHKMKL